MQHKQKKLTDVYLVIARNIKKYRRINKLTQKELALKSGYSYAYIRRVEGPKCIKNFSIQTIYNLSKALNVDIQELFDEEDI